MHGEKDRRPKSHLEAFLLGYRYWYLKGYGKPYKTIRHQPCDCVFDCDGGSRKSSNSRNRSCTAINCNIS